MANKKIIVHCTDEQYEQMLDHWRKGAQLEIQHETAHGIGFNVCGWAGFWWLEVDSQAGRGRDLGPIEWEVV